METTFDQAMINSELALTDAGFCSGEGLDERAAMFAQIGIGWALYAQAKKVAP